jgi:hypothetical protein
MLADAAQNLRERVQQPRWVALLASQGEEGAGPGAVWPSIAASQLPAHTAALAAHS